MNYYAISWFLPQSFNLQSFVEIILWFQKKDCHCSKALFFRNCRPVIFPLGLVGRSWTINLWYISGNRLHVTACCNYWFERGWQSPVCLSPKLIETRTVCVNQAISFIIISSLQIAFTWSKFPSFHGKTIYFISYINFQFAVFLYTYKLLVFSKTRR